MDVRAFETADQAAGSAVAMLGDGERLSRLWRYVFAQLLDDYTSVLRHAGAQADIAHAQLRQIARSQLAVDCEIEHR